jgi:hypothetical protein
MNNSLNKYQAWRSRKEQRSLQRWAEIRAEGKARFVLITSLTYGVSMVGVMDVLNYIFSSAQQSISLGNIIFYLLTGLVVAFVGWSSMEFKYQKALHEARVPKLSTGELPPRDYPLRITSD